nr:uncharacterized protein LOC111418072 [Onthophagus taurus]XP_022906274.1 uncharacterized protein LOC111418072 [Onthophagus taurus]
MIVTQTISLISKNTKGFFINKMTLVINAPNMRALSTLELTKNITLISDEKKGVTIKNLKLTPPQNRPLVVMPVWLLAQNKHIYKYSKFYIDKGFDVLSINVTPWQLLWPVKGTQVVAGDILKFLDSNPSYAPLTLHGFSIGAYLWSEVLVRIAAERQRYQPIVDRITSQVWDSAADITEIPIGVPLAVFPRNKVMQTALRSYMIYHLKTFDKVATCHYIRASQMFHTNMVHAPALFFISKKDPVGAVTSNVRVRDSWESVGMKVTWKCFDDSPHVGHMQKHPEEYLDALNKQLDSAGMVNAREKLQAKL